MFNKKSRLDFMETNNHDDLSQNDHEKNVPHIYSFYVNILFFPFEMEERSSEISDQPYIEWLITHIRSECMREMGRREKEKEEKEMRCCSGGRRGREDEWDDGEERRCGKRRKNGEEQREGTEENFHSASVQESEEWVCTRKMG